MNASQEHRQHIQAVFLPELFATNNSRAEGEPAVITGVGFGRCWLQMSGEVVRDRFDEAATECAALRLDAGGAGHIKIGLSGTYQLQAAAAGGWLLTPKTPGLDAYWIPQPPTLRRLDKGGHILGHRIATVAGFNVSADGLAITIEQPAGYALDIVIWRLPAQAADVLQGLQQLAPLERQRYFLWSSHTSYARPADLYLHWVHGHVYENHEVWPKYWRVCSELDAYALYVTLTGLLRATGKRLYDCMRLQVVFSVIARQADDGGWYHGEWTDEMESHYRLHAGGMHLLAAHFEETRDPVVKASLDRAAAFAATQTDRLGDGTWYLHDSLEVNPQALRKYPFRYVTSRALGKSESNLLVLNTHLDTNIAMARHRQVTGEGQHDALIASASEATRAVISLRPAEWLFRPLFWAISLTFLPTKQAQALPLPLRAVKRIAWKYLIPRLPDLKRFWPRLVMPGGYIERELTMRAFSVRYQPVNLMDLVRTRRLFDATELDPLLTESFGFTERSGLTARWKELKGKEDDSLGFWAEALYHLALDRPDQEVRAWLAQAMIDLEDNGLGLPPSLLGANAEAVHPDAQLPCPGPNDVRLRIANLSHGATVEWLVVNPTRNPLALQWVSRPQAEDLTWLGSAGPLEAGDTTLPTLPPRGWALCRGLRSATV